MIGREELTDEVIPGIDQVYKDYGSVLPAAVYTVSLSDTTHIKYGPGVNKKGKPFTKLSGLTLRVEGDRNGGVEGVPVGRTLPFQQAWMDEIVNTIYSKTELAAGADVPRTTNAQAEFLETIAESGKTFKVKVDWSAFDSELYNSVLVELAETEDREDPIEAAKELATGKMKDEASNRATLAKTYADFPLNEKTGERIGVITTADGEIRARAEVVRYFLATTPETTEED